MPYGYLGKEGLETLKMVERVNFSVVIISDTYLPEASHA